MNGFSIEMLSKRETQILRLAARGLTDKEIAIKIGVSLGTVRTYWERLRQKMEAPNRGAAIATFLNSSFAAQILSAPTPDQLMHEAIGAALGGIIVLNSEDVITGASDKAEKLLDAEPGALVGRHVSAIVARHYEAFHFALRRVASGAECTCTITAFVRTDAKHEFVVHVTVHGLEREDGRHTVLFVRNAVEEIDARRRGVASRMATSGLQPNVGKVPVALVNESSLL